MTKKSASRSSPLTVAAENVLLAHDLYCDSEFSDGPEDFCVDCELYRLCYALEELRAQLKKTKEV